MPQSANVNLLRANDSLSLMINRSGSLPPLHLNTTIWCTLERPVGVQHVIYVQGQNNCIAKVLQYTIVEIGPPRCTISCLTSHSAIINVLK